VIYIDASAVLKLVVAAPETAALRSALAANPVHVAASIVEVEVLRIVRRVAPDHLGAAQRVMDTITLVDFDERIRARAAHLDPAGVRTLDAVHLATALEIGDVLEAVVTYDGRLAAAAASNGLRFLSPA
jgi:predicted nucleic acid-binding protein